MEIIENEEIRNIISTYHQIDWTKEKVALATVVSVEESAYRRLPKKLRSQPLLKSLLILEIEMDIL